MLPIGRLEGIRGTRAQVMSAWQARFERAGCEVERARGGRMVVRLPSWDAALMAPGPEGPGMESAAQAMGALHRWFADCFTLSVSDDGVARYRLIYFSPAQRLFHALVTMLFAAQALIAGLGGEGMGADPARLALGFVVAQLVPPLVTLVSFRIALSRASGRATGSSSKATRRRCTPDRAPRRRG
jgi:hypothetical protein